MGDWASKRNFTVAQISRSNREPDRDRRDPPRKQSPRQQTKKQQRNPQHKRRQNLKRKRRQNQSRKPRTCHKHPQSSMTWINFAHLAITDTFLIRTTVENSSNAPIT